MPRPRLDQIDRHILHDLQNDGRMTNVDLAKRVGISAPPCLRRVKNLEEAGVIRGYHAEINPEALGYGVIVFAHVQLESQTESDLKRFEDQVAGWPMVRECDMLAGEYDFLLKIVSRGWDEYQEFLTSELEAAPNVESVISTLAIRQSKWLPGVPLEVDSEALAPVDPAALDDVDALDELDAAEADGTDDLDDGLDDAVPAPPAKPARKRGRKKASSA